jgi:hypothetical protein
MVMVGDPGSGFIFQNGTGNVEPRYFRVGKGVKSIAICRTGAFASCCGVNLAEFKVGAWRNTLVLTKILLFPHPGLTAAPQCSFWKSGVPHLGQTAARQRSFWKCGVPHLGQTAARSAARGISKR